MIKRVCNSSRGCRTRPWNCAWAAVLSPVLLVGTQAWAQAGDQADGQVLDRVIAVVNNQVILESDLDLEMRVAHILPLPSEDASSPAAALSRVTTRALIEQQILQEDPHGMDVSQKELDAGLVQLRSTIAECGQKACDKPEGWAAYLATFGLTPEDVRAYLGDRLAELRFIEQRFRSGIRITPEEIQKYYAATIVSKFAKLQNAPPLNGLSERIQEILLEQQVNALLDDWLKSLQDEGQVEILDPSLRTAVPEKAVAPVPVSSGVIAPPGGGL